MIIFSIVLIAVGPLVTYARVQERRIEMYERDDGRK